ncbi:MAG: DNA polymerase III subunit delta', partial [Gammaproteobacteria bacterium]|nr:DNA polymerase III subunit delta' [Gammaproteobacteria bacterium]
MGEVSPRYLPWQENILQRALRLKRQQQLPHAVMIESASDQDISGFAWYLSLLLLCDNPDDLSACANCEACRMMQAGTYSDFRLVTLEQDEKSKKISKNIKIEQIRDLKHEISLTHQYDRLKIAAIYPAEAMSTAGANALLKTLEEPAAAVLLLLLTHNRGRIPVTLRSRCQLWTINLPKRAQALDWLQQQGLSQQDAASYL